MRTTIFASLALLLIVALSPSGSRAATLVSTNLNTVSVGSGSFSGSISQFDQYQQDLIGVLPSMMSITFNYSLSSAVPGAAMLYSTGYALPSYNVSAAVNAGGTPASYQSPDGLVLASASMGSMSSGQTVITNLTSGLINFQSTLIAFLMNGVSLSGTYVVSAVPLPAALPFMIVGALGLAGVSARRRKA